MATGAGDLFLDVLGVGVFVLFGTHEAHAAMVDGLLVGEEDVLFFDEVVGFDLGLFHLGHLGWIRWG